MISDLQRVLDPAYLAGLVASSTDDLRTMRAECADLENGLSFVRRLAQGRLDVLAAETERRANGGGGDLAEIIAMSVPEGVEALALYDPKGEGGIEGVATLADESALPVIVAEDPLTCVARGGGKAMEIMEKHRLDMLSTE